MSDNRPNTSKRRHNIRGSLSKRRPSEPSGIKKRRKSSGTKYQQQPSKIPTETKLTTNRGRQPNKLPPLDSKLTDSTISSHAEPYNQSAERRSRPASVPATQESNRAIESEQVETADPEQPELKSGTKTGKTHWPETERNSRTHNTETCP